jgi:hypothetical protein
MHGGLLRKAKKPLPPDCPFSLYGSKEKVGSIERKDPSEEEGE